MLEDRILVIDDDGTIRNMFISIFSNIGYIVASAETAEESLRYMEQKYFHLIFIDLNLPGMNGIDLCKKIRETNSTSTIIAITGYGPLYNIDECKKAGFDYYFKKPIRLEKLLEITKKVFENQVD